MVRARQSLSAGGVLRPLLSKYSIDYNTVTVVFSGTLEAIRNSVSIGNIGTRSLTVMSQSQYNGEILKELFIFVISCQFCYARLSIYVFNVQTFT